MGSQRPAAGSGESLAKKLGVKPEGMTIALPRAPDGFAERIGVEDGNYDTDVVTGTYDLILLFTASRVLLREFFPIAINCLEPNGKIWICCPKKSEGQKTDLTIPHGTNACRIVGLDRDQPVRSRNLERNQI